jgi:IS5 family transposase
VAYRDKGYFGVSCKAYNATMDRTSRNKPLTIKEKMRNKRISSKRSPGERPFAVIKRVLKSGHVIVTTIARTHVKNMASNFCYNLKQLNTIQKRALS